MQPPTKMQHADWANLSRATRAKYNTLVYQFDFDTTSNYTDDHIAELCMELTCDNIIGQAVMGRDLCRENRTKKLWWANFINLVCYELMCNFLNPPKRKTARRRVQ